MSCFIDDTPRKWHPFQTAPLFRLDPVKVLANSRITPLLEALMGNPLHWPHCAIFSTPTKCWANDLQVPPGAYIAHSTSRSGLVCFTYTRLSMGKQSSKWKRLGVRLIVTVKMLHISIQCWFRDQCIWIDQWFSPVCHYSCLEKMFVLFFSYLQHSYWVQFPSY